MVPEGILLKDIQLCKTFLGTFGRGHYANCFCEFVLNFRPVFHEEMAF